MSSFNLPFMRPRRPRLTVKGRFRSRGAQTAMAQPTRTVATQRSAGRPWGGSTSKALSAPTTVSRATATTVATQLPARGSKKSQKSKALIRIPKKSVQVNTVNEMVRAYTRNIYQIYQALNEGESSSGFNKLFNIAGSTAEKPLHFYCLNTLDRPISSVILGDAYPLFKMNADTSFVKDSNIPVVFGNHTGTKLFTGENNKMLCSSLKIKLQFYGRSHKETTYTVKVIRFKKPYSHMLPYLGPEESTTLTGLQSSQIQERKAVLVDSILRPQTVNPVVISGYALPRVKNVFEVIYSRRITIDELLTDADQTNRDMVSISIPYNKMMDYNHEIDTRYKDQNDGNRVDTALNTSITDLVDTIASSKPKHYQGLWLMVTANNTTSTSEDPLTDPSNVNYDPTRVPSYDVSFRVDYKYIANVS